MSAQSARASIKQRAQNHSKTQAKSKIGRPQTAGKPSLPAFLSSRSRSIALSMTVLLLCSYGAGLLLVRMLFRDHSVFEPARACPQGKSKKVALKKTNVSARKMFHVLAFGLPSGGGHRTTTTASMPQSPLCRRSPALPSSIASWLQSLACPPPCVAQPFWCS